MGELRAKYIVSRACSNSDDKQFEMNIILPNAFCFGEHKYPTVPNIVYTMHLKIGLFIQFLTNDVIYNDNITF